MPHLFWNAYFGWGWLLWRGILTLFLSSFGNWRHGCSAHRKYSLLSNKEALDILNERYAKGEITRGRLGKITLNIAKA